MQLTELARGEFNQFVELRRRLIEADPEIDETTLLDTLEGATNLTEALGEVIRSALNDEAFAHGLKLRLEQMRERLSRIESTSEKKRQVALAIMEESGIEKILEPDFTVSIRMSPPAVVITNQDEIPEGYWVPQSPRLDKRGTPRSPQSGNSNNRRRTRQYTRELERQDKVAMSFAPTQTRLLKAKLKGTVYSRARGRRTGAPLS